MSGRVTFTARVPSGLLAEIRDFKQERQSVNDFIVEVLTAEVRRRKGLATHQKILDLVEQMRADSGPHPDSTQMIRDLREGRGRHDDAPPLY